MTPETRKEKYLAKASSDYSGELPEPVTREEKYLFKIAESGGGGGNDGSAYAHSLELTINSQTYVLTATLKNTSGEALGTSQTIDLPLETMVVGGSYDDTTKKVILTLKNGNTVDFSVADLVEGLQTEITSINKLNSDLVDDTNQNNKFVSSAEKEKINNALTEEVYNAGKQIKTNKKTGEIFNDYSRNVAVGNCSHAEGANTTARGDNSHAEGCETIASSVSSHAEGGNTTASGNVSHAEGYHTTASGGYSHAEGDHTTASGYCSHAEGDESIASSACQHVQGRYNVEDSSSKYAFIIGNGTANNRSNAFAVDWNGKIYVNNSETGVDVSQLQPIINSSNKLSADFVDDTNTSNKFVTSDEKTKISNNNSALIDLIDSGQKNLVDAQNPSGQQRVTITKGANGGVVISCENAAWATTAYSVYVTPNEDYKLILYVDNADLSNVLFRCFTSAVDDSDTELEVLSRTERITETGVYTLDINAQYNRIKISPNINNSATAGSGSATMRMMLCSKAAWDISQKYVPYRPSYDELVARITALENA